jgi:hypothetical protein
MNPIVTKLEPAVTAESAVFTVVGAPGNAYDFLCKPLKTLGLLGLDQQMPDSTCHDNRIACHELNDVPDRRNVACNQRQTGSAA